MRYERVREAGVILNQAVLIAIGVDWDGRRQVLAVELANRESRSSWREFLRELKARGLSGVEFVVADDHAGLRAALREELAEATYQRCCVHLLRNALDYVPRRVDDDCLQELRWLYGHQVLEVAHRSVCGPGTAAQPLPSSASSSLPSYSLFVLMEKSTATWLCPVAWVRAR